MPILDKVFLMEGMVKFFDRKSGTGAIIGNDGREYYVHVTSVMTGPLSEGDPVKFTPAETDNGLEALKVVRLGEGEKPVKKERLDHPEEEPAGEPVSEYEEVVEEEIREE